MANNLGLSREPGGNTQPLSESLSGCVGAGVDLNVCDGHINVAEGSLWTRAGCGIADADVYKRDGVCGRRFPAAAATRDHKCAHDQNHNSEIAVYARTDLHLHRNQY